MLLAAEDRYREAEELLLDQELDGCIYLFGYAVEMWMEAACLRLRAVGPAAHVKAALPPLKAWMKLTAPTVVFTDYHDLEYFAECVIQLRHNQSRPLPLTLLRDLQVYVMHGMHSEWVVDMRYRRSGLTQRDAWNALLNAWWARTNWTLLI
jgi:hypothetical protein